MNFRLTIISLLLLFTVSTSAQIKKEKYTKETIAFLLSYEGNVHIDGELATTKEIKKLHPDSISSIFEMTRKVDAMGKKLPLDGVFVETMAASRKAAEERGEPLLMLDRKETTQDVITKLGDRVELEYEQGGDDLIEEYGEKAKFGVRFYRTVPDEEYYTISFFTKNFLTNEALFFLNEKECSFAESKDVDFNTMSSVIIMQPKVAQDKYGEKGQYGALLITTNPDQVNTKYISSINDAFNPELFDKLLFLINGEVASLDDLELQDFEKLLMLIFVNGNEALKQLLGNLAEGKELGLIMIFDESIDSEEFDADIVLLDVKYDKDDLIALSKYKGLIILDGVEVSDKQTMLELKADEIRCIAQTDPIVALETYGKKAENGVISVSREMECRFLSALPIPSTTLLMIDGQKSTEKDLRLINPQNMDGIQVVKGEAAKEYGEDYDAVYIITTKVMKMVE